MAHISPFVARQFGVGITGLFWTICINISDNLGHFGPFLDHFGHFLPYSGNFSQATWYWYSWPHFNHLPKHFRLIWVILAILLQLTPFLGRQFGIGILASLDHLLFVFGFCFWPFLCQFRVILGIF